MNNRMHKIRIWVPIHKKNKRESVREISFREKKQRMKKKCLTFDKSFFLTKPKRFVKCQISKKKKLFERRMMLFFDADLQCLFVTNPQRSKKKC